MGQWKKNPLWTWKHPSRYLLIGLEGVLPILAKPQISLPKSRNNNTYFARSNDYIDTLRHLRVNKYLQTNHYTAAVDGTLRPSMDVLKHCLLNDLGKVEV